MVNENEKAIHNWVALLTEKRFSDFYTVWTEDCVLRQGPGLGEARNMEEFALLAGRFANACPDATTELVSIASAGDIVHASFVNRGKHTGDFVGIPPTGKEIELWTMGVFRIVGGRIAEVSVIDDYASVLAQLGAFPPAK